MQEKKGKLTIQCNKLWPFPDNKDNKQWVGCAMEVETYEIIGVYIGSRDEDAAKGFMLIYSGKVITVFTTPARSAFAVTLISLLATPLTTHSK